MSELLQDTPMAFMIRLGASLFSFTAAFLMLLGYIRERKSRFLAATGFLLALFLISFQGILTIVPNPVFETLEQAAPLRSGIGGLALHGLTALLFITGGTGFLFSLTRIEPTRRVVAAVASYSAGVLLYLTAAEASDLTLALLPWTNLLVLWIPTLTMCLTALFRFQYFTEGFHRPEKITLLVLGGLVSLCGLSLLFLPQLGLIAPFFLILLLSILVLVAAIRFAPPNGPTHAGTGGLSESFIREHGISPREQEIISSILEGRSNKEIAFNLHISLKTVETHLSRIYKKTGSEGRLALFTRLSGRSD